MYTDGAYTFKDIQRIKSVPKRKLIVMNKQILVNQ